MFKTSLMLLVCVLLTGCASLSKEECQRGDWFHVGYTDGTEGYTEARFNEHIQACESYHIQPNQTLYQQGREQGLQMYCQSKGYALGQNNQNYGWVCPKSAERKFLTDYVFGLKSALQEAQLSYQQKQIDLNVEVTKLIAMRVKDDKNKQSTRIEALRQDLRSLEQKQRDILGKINHVEHYLRTTP